VEERADDRRWIERLWLLGTGLVAIGCGFAVLFVTGDAGARG
jgi:hypothetical protein